MALHSVTEWEVLYVPVSLTVNWAETAKRALGIALTGALTMEGAALSLKERR